MTLRNAIIAFCFVITCFNFAPLFAQNNNLGIFDGQSDVGNTKLKGSIAYELRLQQYTITGSGSNIWTDHDGFHFVWKRMKGDFILTANAAFIGQSKQMHRKFGWMVRSSLDSNSKHISAVVHGDGLTSIQYRRSPGVATEEKKSSITGADVIQLERRGSTYTMWVARKGEPFVTEKITDVDLGDDVYVGLFVCSHDNNVIEKAIFNNVRVVVPAPVDFKYPNLIGSNLQILDVATQNSTIIYQSPLSLQAPNWTKDGKSLIYNSNDLLYKFDLKTNTSEVLNTGVAKHNNNDHVISFDGKTLAVSNGEQYGSIGYTVPINGGDATRITKTGPSFMHGWSPDGKYIVFCGDRNNEFDVYKIPSTGGDEVRLTNAPGLDDGPEYSPDGKYIYFCSVRTGLMQVWKMKPDGSEQTQVTNDEFNNWFPHVSPDGKWIVFISFLKDEVSPGDHPFYKHVYLRLMPVAGGKPKVIAYLYGGQGTINTPSWSPDSKKIAFISNTQLMFPIFPLAKN